MAMNKDEKSEIVTGAQIALGEKYDAPFWDEVGAELDKLAPGEKPGLKVSARLTRPE